MQSLSPVQRTIEAEATAGETFPLSLEQYNALEKSALQRYTPYIARQFQPQTFYQVSFQTHVTDASELWKFIDSQQDARFEHNMVELLSNQLTAKEYELFTYLAERTVAYCKHHGFAPISGRNALSRAMIAIRAIMQVAPPGSTIMEAGPGSGYVTAGLVKLGYKVVCYDVTQSLFLHQSSFWHFLFGNRYSCCADSDIKIDLENHDLCHVTWWNFVDTDYRLPRIDVLTVNHAVNEMLSLSVRFMLYRIGQSNASHPYKIVIEDTGSHFHDNYRQFIRPHFKLLHDNDHMLSKKYVPVIVLESLANAPTKTCTEAPIARLGFQERLRNHAQEKLSDDHKAWHLLYKIHMAFPRLSRLVRHTVHKVLTILQSGWKRMPVLESSAQLIPTVVLNELKLSSLPLRYTYADVQKFFDTVLPEGNNLTQYEEFAKLIGTTEHM